MRGEMATGIRDPSGNSTYTFASQPRAVAPQRNKFRDADAVATGTIQPCNIMYDPRVVRGNTWRSNTTAGTTTEDPVEIQRRREARRRKQARARAAAKVQKVEVDPVPGRMHIEVQTDVYLEELTDRVEETDIAVQTDPFLDRAPDPVFIPAKTGIDAETQIEDGELFDFDLESKPVLEVLVGKTIEQAMMEVMEEEELDRLRDHQLKFEELRNAELIETQRLEEQARRRREEKERRLKQQADVAAAEHEATKKIAARSFAQSYLSGLVPSVFKNLEDGGYFFDTQEREIEAEFMPWLMDQVDVELTKFTRARALLDDIILKVIKAQNPNLASSEPVHEGESAAETQEGGAADESAAVDNVDGESNPTGESDAGAADTTADGDAAKSGADGDEKVLADAKPDGGDDEGGEGGDDDGEVAPEPDGSGDTNATDPPNDDEDSEKKSEEAAEPSAAPEAPTETTEADETPGDPAAASE